VLVWFCITLAAFCKNYNYMFVFAKVIPKTLLVPFFSGHGVLSLFLDCWWCGGGMCSVVRMFVCGGCVVW